MYRTDRLAPCGKCGGAVFKSLQPNGRFYIVNGKAVCTPCRVMAFSKSSASAMMKHTKRGQKADNPKKEAQMAKQEKERVARIAEESQKRTKTKKTNGNSKNVSK